MNRTGWKVGGLISGILMAAVLAGCSTQGPPSALEQRFFAIETNHVTRIVSVTNEIPVFVTNQVVQTVTQTNQLNQVAPVQVTNVVVETRTQTNVVTATNEIPVYTYKPNDNAATVGQIGGAIGAPFGAGGLVTTAIAGIFALWGGIRSRQYAAAAAGQSAARQVADQTSGVLTQNIETLLAVLNGTPQGQALLPTIKNYLASHQAEEGVVGNVAQIIRTSVDEPAAQQAAGAILKALATLKS